MSAADEREKAMKAASIDFEKGLRLARNVSDPWYRCQSLATSARFAPGSEVVRIAEEALAVAMLGKDGYKRVAVAAWPIRALAERGKFPQAKRLLAPLLEEAHRIEHPVCKMDALAVLWAGVWPLPTDIKRQVLDTLLTACLAANSWKAGRIMQYVALAVANEDKTRAQRIIDTMRDSVYKRQAQRRFDAGKFETVPFPFPPF